MSKNIKAVVVILALALIGVIIWAVVGQSNLGSLQSSLDQVSGQLTEQQALVAEKEKPPGPRSATPRLSWKPPSKASRKRRAS